MPEPLTITAVAVLLPYASSLLPNSWGRSNMLRGDTAASIQQVTVVVAPTGVTSVMTDTHLPAAESFAVGIAGSANWMEVAQAVFGDSRSMSEVERNALDEFTWAELQS